MTDSLSFRIKKKIDRYIHDPLVALVILPFFLILKILPYKISSLLCGFILFLIAPFSKYQKRVMKNLNIAFPKKKEVEKFSDLFGSKETNEGLKAFVEKRKANFR